MNPKYDRKVARSRDAGGVRRRACVRAVDGTLAGVVRDSTGAAVPGANVTVVNQQTGAGRTVVSGSDGSFSVSDLAPGAYTVTVQIKGFRNASQKDVQVTAGGTAKTELALRPGWRRP
jgi:hypothetical protein